MLSGRTDISYNATRIILYFSHLISTFVPHVIVIVSVFVVVAAVDESTRVFLQPIRGIDGSDYINASFIDVS